MVQEGSFDSHERENLYAKYSLTRRAHIRLSSTFLSFSWYCSHWRSVDTSQSTIKNNEVCFWKPGSLHASRIRRERRHATWALCLLFSDSHRRVSPVFEEDRYSRTLVLERRHDHRRVVIWMCAERRTRDSHTASHMRRTVSGTHRIDSLGFWGTRKPEQWCRRNSLVATKTGFHMRAERAQRHNIGV